MAFNSMITYTFSMNNEDDLYYETHKRSTLFLSVKTSFWGFRIDNLILKG